MLYFPGNSYAEFLNHAGYTCLRVDNIDWFIYQGFLMPAYLFGQSPKISRSQAQRALELTHCPFIRWDDISSSNEYFPWYYIGKQGKWNINDIKDGKKRRKIRKSKKTFSTRLLNYEEAMKLCPKVAHKAQGRYQGSGSVENEEEIERAVFAGKKVDKTLEFFGCFLENTLVSYTQNYCTDSTMWFFTVRHDPAYLSQYSSYALIDGLLEHYLNTKSYKLILDGCRNLHHQTNFQDQLIKNFSFKKIPAKLSIHYANWFRPLLELTKISKPLLPLANKILPKSIQQNIDAILLQDEIANAS